MSLRNLILETDLKARAIQTGGRIYFLCAGLPIVVATFEACSKFDYWPSGPKIFTACLAGTLSGLVALKAFKDGSYQIHQDSINSTPINNVDKTSV